MRYQQRARDIEHAFTDEQLEVRRGIDTQIGNTHGGQVLPPDADVGHDIGVFRGAYFALNTGLAIA